MKAKLTRLDEQGQPTGVTTEVELRGISLTTHEHPDAGSIECVYDTTPLVFRPITFTINRAQWEPIWRLFGIDPYTYPSPLWRRVTRIRRARQRRAR